MTLHLISHPAATKILLLRYCSPCLRIVLLTTQQWQQLPTTTHTPCLNGWKDISQVLATTGILDCTQLAKWLSTIILTPCNLSLSQLQTTFLCTVVHPLTPSSSWLIALITLFPLQNTIWMVFFPCFTVPVRRTNYKKTHMCVFTMCPGIFSNAQNSEDGRLFREMVYSSTRRI